MAVRGEFALLHTTAGVASAATAAPAGNSKAESVVMNTCVRHLHTLPAVMIDMIMPHLPMRELLCDVSHVCRDFAAPRPAFFPHAHVDLDDAAVRLVLATPRAGHAPPSLSFAGRAVWGSRRRPHQAAGPSLSLGSVALRRAVGAEPGRPAGLRCLDRTGSHCSSPPLPHSLCCTPCPSRCIACSLGCRAPASPGCRPSATCASSWG